MMVTRSSPNRPAVEESSQSPPCSAITHNTVQKRSSLRPLVFVSHLVIRILINIKLDFQLCALRVKIAWTFFGNSRNCKN